MKVAWLTDVHLDNVDSQAFNEFAQSIINTSPDALLITGDISTANKLVYTLSALEKLMQRPMYYVLGNHDFWGSTFASVRKETSQLNVLATYLKYLPVLHSVRLTQTTTLVGVDGWYDAQSGDPFGSNMVMNDWLYIRDIRERSITSSLVKKCQEYAQESVTQLHKSLLGVIRDGCKNVIVATHVPPFSEAHRHKGQNASNSMCWYVNTVLGKLLSNAAKAHPEVNFTVFCGHTHERCDVKVSHNLSVHVGDATYGAPKIQDVIEVA